MTRFLAALLLLLVGQVYSYGDYRYLVPNGERVPHPCRPNYFWHGLGHNNALGGGTRNKFGEDFAKAGHKWTRELCQMDSDLDGKTNGDELGDPDCLWSSESGVVPLRASGITHPAVCEPFDSPACKEKNTWVSCKGLELECDPLKEPGVKNFTLQFPETPVPAKDTTYICMVFDVPSDKDYHLIGDQALIVNENIMHHILIYGCMSTDAEIPAEPYTCGMGAGYGCTTLIGAWGVGTAGTCLNKNVGVLFGASKYKRFALEFHWNNPRLSEGQTDSSGVTFFYTETLRPNNGGLFVTGQTLLAIPPRQDSMTYTQYCSADCTRKLLSQKIYVTEAFNHMHYLGRAGSMQHLRDGKHIQYFTNESEYSYDSPKFFNYDPPLEFLPGDSIKTTCVFSSKYSDKYVYYGDATSDEMCFGFFYYYPEEAAPIQACTDSGDIETCYGQIEVIRDECSINAFVKGTDEDASRLFDLVNSKCNLPALLCTDECLGAVKEVFNHPCFRSTNTRKQIIRELQIRYNGLKFVSKLAMCFVDWEKASPEIASPGSASSASFNFLSAPFTFLLVLKFLF